MIFKNDIIEFICDERLKGVIPEPTIAAKNIPEWFKKIKPYAGRHRDGFKVMTAKKCMPLLDSMTYGYTIPLAADVHVITNHDCSVIKAENLESSSLNTIERHGKNQVDSEAWPGYKQDPIKFINHWLIKTKPGWSCLFVSPLNNLNLPFTTLAGIVDTDSYFNMINFPAVWTAANYDDMIPRGTPIVQVIPFKRAKFDQPKCRTFTKKELREYDKTMQKVSSSVSVYKNDCREPR